MFRFIVDIVACREFIDMYSLEHLATLKVAILVCESEEVQNMLRGFRQTIDRNSNVVLVDSQWKELLDQVKRNLNQIGMPDLIIDIVLEKLWPISFEIFKWIVHHTEVTGIESPSNHCWTPQFSIDYVKTTKSLINNDTLDIKSRFKLACFYCLDTEVRSLWEEMSLSEKRCFFMRGNLKRSKQNPIVLYWTYYIQEEQLDYWGSNIKNPTYLFKYAVQNGYLSATKYFLGKLNTNSKERMIMNGLTIHLHHKYKPQLKVREQLAIACFLFCSTIYSVGSPLYLVLVYFLEWPLQKHFMTVVNGMMEDPVYGTSFKKNFAPTLEAIIEKDLKDFKDCDYKALFVEFWHKCLKCQAHVNTNSETGYNILMKFVKSRFGFVLEENSFAMKAKFRAALFQQDIPGNETPFDKGDVDFFKFLILERVVIKSVVESISIRQHSEFSGLPLGELMYLIDGILETV